MVKTGNVTFLFGWRKTIIFGFVYIDRLFIYF